MALVQVKVPDIGDFKDVVVIEVLVKPGDVIEPEQSLITVESDKASMEIPSNAAGVVKELAVKLGDTVNAGSVVLTVETEDAEIPAAPSAVSAASPRSGPVEADLAQSAAASSVTGTDVQVRVPDIGNFKDVTVIEVFVKPGDTVKVEQSLITLESDKASMEIPSSHAGVVKEVYLKLGDKVNVGNAIALLEGVVLDRGTPAAPQPAQAALAVTAAALPTVPADQSVVAPASVVNSTAVASALYDPAKPPVGLPHASPSVRKFARELGVPLEEVKGSGPKGRITQADVQGFSRAVMRGDMKTQAQAAKAPAHVGAGLDLLPWPSVDFAKFGAVERKPLSRIKKISGANLARNWVMIPHVTNNDEADITELEAFRVAINKENEKSDIKITMLAFVIKATVTVLKKFPEFNASLDGDELVYKKYFHIGFAADTSNGLVVPVLRDADQKGVLQISHEMSDLAKKARDGKLGPADMTGGCFSISSLGGIGGTHFTPIINAPEVAILGLSRSVKKLVWSGKQFVPRLMLPLSLSYDHRVIDGAAAARFNAYLGQLLADFRRIVL